MASPPALAGRVALLVVLVVAAAACGIGAWLGAWWVPFLAGAGTGVLHRTWRPMPRGALLAAVLGALLGWALPLWIMALASLPAGATARAIAALAGLPAYAWVTVVVTLLLAALQVLVGAWLARAILPRRTVTAGGAVSQERRASVEDPQT
ncbi:MAG TPA: hypothetical protein VIZ43_26235 [Trebonia sp.]